MIARSIPLRSEIDVVFVCICESFEIDFSEFWNRMMKLQNGRVLSQNGETSQSPKRMGAQ